MGSKPALDLAREQATEANGGCRPSPRRNPDNAIVAPVAAEIKILAAVVSVTRTGAPHRGGEDWYCHVRHCCVTELN